MLVELCKEKEEACTDYKWASIPRHSIAIDGGGCPFLKLADDSGLSLSNGSVFDVSVMNGCKMRPMKNEECHLCADGCVRIVKKEEKQKSFPWDLVRRGQIFTLNDGSDKLRFFMKVSAARNINDLFVGICLNDGQIFNGSQMKLMGVFRLLTKDECLILRNEFPEVSYAVGL